METTYEGTKKVKDTKLQMLTTCFEELKMSENLHNQNRGEREILDEAIFILKKVKYKSAKFEFKVFRQDSRALRSNGTAQENLSSFKSPIKAVINKQLQSN